MGRSTLPYQRHNWQETKIWQLLEAIDKPDAEAVRTVLQLWMPSIQMLLAQGGTSPTDFTLHDAEHAFRVAQRMVELMPTDTMDHLSVYELALLLLAAYLHDIGMLPEQSKIKAHLEYLLWGESNDLSEHEKEIYQLWLDNQQVLLPFTEGHLTSENLQKANLLVTHYCRSQHVHWSEEWIQNNIPSHNLGSYVQWVDDLKKLCRSHHQGYEELIKEPFEPKPVGSPAQIVHLRYLAAVLRIADILEFDPERTPDVVFKHRDISPGSILYWYKDHSASYFFENSRLTIVARPTDARSHRAIELMANDIETELSTVRRLADERPFQVSRFQDTPLYHKWNTLPDIRRDIRPSNDSYEYIDGAFRPNTEKLLQLLSGRQLYGNEMVAVRELLQNAFDAVGEQIAYEQLDYSGPQSGDLEKSLGAHHAVRLELIQDNEKRYWLCCTDDGVGMTKEIIRDYLLVSGNSYHPDIRVLERRCKTAGIRLHRTGQFGIGVLSYFMLADLVKIQTRRSGLAQSLDASGWTFETEGIGSFGELRKDNTLGRGTKVCLRLREDIFDSDVEAWYEDLASYLESSIAHIPCNFKLRSDLPNSRNVVFSPGWTGHRDRLLGFNFLYSAYAASEESEDPLLPSDLKQSLSERANRSETIANIISDSLTIQTIEGTLLGNLGRFRIHFYCFKLVIGNAPVFLKIIKNKSQLIIDELLDNEDYYGISGDLTASWKGMSLSNSTLYNQTWESKLRPYSIEIDWYDPLAGTISIDRERLATSDLAARATYELIEKADKMWDELFLSRNDHLALINNFKLTEPQVPKAFYWQQVVNMSRRWLPIEFPATNWETVPTYLYKVPLRPFYESKQLNVIYPLLGKSTLGLGNIAWDHAGFAPDRFAEALSPLKNFYLTPIWITAPTTVPNPYLNGYRSEFPSGWHQLMVVVLKGLGNKGVRLIWNHANPISQLEITKEQIEWSERLFRPNDEEWIFEATPSSPRILDPRPHWQELLQSKEKSALWISKIINMATDGSYGGDFSERIINFWIALTETHSGQLAQIWELIFGSPEIPQYVFKQSDSGTGHLWKLSPTLSNIIESPKLDTIHAIFPEPSSEFIVEYRKP